jgi:hypothetical protein
MKTQKYRQYTLVSVLALVLSLSLVGTAVATQSSSPHYMVNETQFGSGAAVQQCSTGQYCAKTSVGDTTVGGSSSDNYSAQTGFNTTDEPLLEVTVTGGNQNLGTLDPSTTASAASVIKVRSYLSNGYVMQISGTPPSQGAHALTALTTPSTSHAGAEQFGINLVANNTPAIGANPVQVPSGSVSFGYVTDDYLTPDLFKYADGDIVAQSDTSSGETDYTMSMMINISNVTPGGRYSGTFSAVVVPLY